MAQRSDDKNDPNHKSLLDLDFFVEILLSKRRLPGLRRPHATVHQNPTVDHREELTKQFRAKSEYP